MPPTKTKPASPNGPRRRVVAMPPVDQIRTLAEIFHKGGLTPKDVSRPEQIAVRIIAGWEIGLTPVQSVNNILVVNGRASIWGDAALALVLASGLMEKHDEDIEGGGDDRLGYCIVKRKGSAEEKRSTFSMQDAQTAKLWGKSGPWQNYPDRMLKMRARAFALRDVFTDVLCGLGIIEEEMDVPGAKPSEATPVPACTGESGSAAGGAPACATPGPITKAQLEAIGQARPAWLRSINVNPDCAEAVKAAWLKKLGEYATDSAQKLDAEQAGRLLGEIRSTGNQQEIKELFQGTPTA